MIKYAAFILILAVRILHHPLSASEDTAPFASPSPLPTVTTGAEDAHVISIEGNISNNKVIVNWVVGDNAAADQFEVEKSADGKNFTMAALVFGTDREEKDSYQFYEKVGNQKLHYRIKLISKDRKLSYSETIEINPNLKV